jgi:hypothetical protein
MCGFKIGDVVKCIDLDYNQDGGYVNLNGLYRVRDIEFDCGQYYLHLNTLLGEKIFGCWYTRRFEKVEECKRNLFAHFDEIQIDHKNKSVVLSKNSAQIKIYNDLTPEGRKRIELWNVVTYHNDKCEIADEKTRKAIESACEIYDMVFA